jgi:hypothetical protein
MQPGVVAGPEHEQAASRYKMGLCAHRLNVLVAKPRTADPERRP